MICEDSMLSDQVLAKLTVQPLTHQIQSITDGKMKNKHIKEIMGVKGKPDIIDIIQQKRLRWFGQVKRMPKERIHKLIVDWIPRERRKRGCPRETWMEGVQAAMTTGNLEPDQWRYREQWRLVSRRRRQLLKKTGQIDR
jgi:hypothetical protein